MWGQCEGSTGDRILTIPWSCRACVRPRPLVSSPTAEIKKGAVPSRDRHSIESERERERERERKKEILLALLSTLCTYQQCFCPLHRMLGAMFLD